MGPLNLSIWKESWTTRHSGASRSWLKVIFTRMDGWICNYSNYWCRDKWPPPSNKWPWLFPLFPFYTEISPVFMNLSLQITRFENHLKFDLEEHCYLSVPRCHYTHIITVLENLSSSLHLWDSVSVNHLFFPTPIIKQVHLN